MSKTHPNRVLVEDGRNHGFSILYNEIVDNTSLSIFAKACYVVLLRHSNRKTDECFLLCDTITAKMGLKAEKGNTATARRAIAELNDAGLISIVKRPGRSSIFKLMDVPKQVADPAPIEQSQKTPCSNEAGDCSNRADHPAPIEQQNNTSFNQTNEQEEFFKTATADAVAGDGEPSSVPSSMKSKKAEHPEHAECSKAFYDDFTGANPDVKLEWHSGFAVPARALLRRNPSMTAAVLRTCLANRRATPGVVVCEEPASYSRLILKYKDVALNEFGKTPGVSPNGTARNSRISPDQKDATIRGNVSDALRSRAAGRMARGTDSYAAEPVS